MTSTTFKNVAMDTTIVTTTGSQTLTNKTMTSPIISTITNTGTITLPTSTDTLVGKATTDSLTNKTFIQRIAIYSPGGAGTTTIDLSTGGVHAVTMPASTQTLAISNGTTGQCFIIEINNVTSQGALTWFTTIRWAGGVAPTLTGTNGKRDTFGFRITGSNTYDGYIVGQNI